MDDDLTRTGPEDSKKINIKQSWEISYWTKTLGVTEEKLKKAVATVGVMVEDVEKWLKNNQ